MNSTSAESPTARRVILRMDSDSIEPERHGEITDAWFHYCDYGEANETYMWSEKHWVHIGGDNANRWHLIIDMEKHRLRSPDLCKLPYEVFRVHRDEGGRL